MLLIRSILASLTVAVLCPSIAFAQTTERVSVDSGGLQGNGSCSTSSISSDGRFVAFVSEATNLVPGDTNGSADTFVHDRQTGQTTRVSVDSGGLQGNGRSYPYGPPSLSSDGRFVVFASEATNLVLGDTNSRHDVFVHDRLTGQTTRASVASGGLQVNGDSYAPCLSSDGRFVAFNSWASNLVQGDTNNYYDAFVHDRQTGQTTRVSVDSGGLQANEDSSTPSLSSDGRFVAFYSYAYNLVPGDTNGNYDVFVHDRQTGQTTRVSVDSGGLQGNGLSYLSSLSSDGRCVAFTSYATNFVPGDTNGAADIFIHDRQTSQTTRVSVDSGGLQGNGPSHMPSLSSDGRFVTFSSYASNLVPGDTNGAADIFVHDRQTSQTTRVSVDSGGLQGNGGYLGPPILCSDGRFVAFVSEATNLVPGDTNHSADVFVHDRGANGPSLAQTGTCHGMLTLTISDASPHGSVAIVHGPAGVFVKPTPPCQGLTLGVATPSLGAVRTADAAGVATLNFNAPPGACGRSVQAVDVTTCVATNVIVL